MLAFISLILFTVLTVELAIFSFLVGQVRQSQAHDGTDAYHRYPYDILGMNNYEFMLQWFKIWKFQMGPSYSEVNKGN